MRRPSSRMADDDDGIRTDHGFPNRATKQHQLDAREDRVDQRHRRQKCDAREIPNVIDVPSVPRHQAKPLREGHPTQRVVLHARKIPRVPRNVLASTHRSRSLTKRSLLFLMTTTTTTTRQTRKYKVERRNEGRASSRHIRARHHTLSLPGMSS